MASLYQRDGIYQIAFSNTIDGKNYQKKFSLGTKSKKEALKKQLEYENLYDRGEIDPFTGWTPKLHDQKANSKLEIVTLSDLSEKFLSDRTQITEVSKVNYSDILRNFQNQVGSTLPVSFISDEDIRDFCFKSHLRPASQANYLRHLKVFFNWLFQEGYVKTDVTKPIKKPVVKKNISDKIISPVELEKIITTYKQDIAEKKKQKLITSDAKSIIWFVPVVYSAFYAGLRLKEVISLRWENINFERKTIFITDTKSGQERAVPIREKLYNELKQWKDKSKNTEIGLVFPSQKSHLKNVKMSGHNVSKVFRSYTKKANLKKTINFHGLRHSCGTELLRIGFDINEVAKILGHSSLEVTRLYEHLTPKDLSDKMNRIESSQSKQEETIQKLQQKIDQMEKEKGDQ